MSNLFSQTVLVRTSIIFLVIITIFISVPIPILVASSHKNGSEECFFLHDYMRKDFNNVPVEILKLQAFLINFEGYGNVSLTGVFDQATFDAVSAFQMKYFDDVLKPWGHIGSTGYVYITTLKKVNEIYCQRVFLLNAQQIKEINTYKMLLESMKEQEETVEKMKESLISTTTMPILPIVGTADPVKRQNSSLTAAILSWPRTLPSTARYFLEAIMILTALHILARVFDTKYMSLRASVKSWYLVCLARAKSMLRDRKKRIAKNLRKPVVKKEIIKETTKAMMIIEPKR